MSSHRSERGMGFVEVLYGAAIACFLILVMGSMFRATTAMVVDSRVKRMASEKIETGMDKLETLIMNANQFDFVSSTAVVFLADLSTDPQFTKAGDFDNDGIPNADDPDMDGDMLSVAPSANDWWRVGSNLKDDDDDNDGQVDMRWRIELDVPAANLSSPWGANLRKAGVTLWVDFQKNGEPWGNHQRMLIDRIADNRVFAPFGSGNDSYYPVNADGSPGFNPFANWNRTVTLNDDPADANDGCKANDKDLAQIGNGNKSLETSRELSKILSFGISLQCDLDKDGKADSKSYSEVIPPCLYLKRL